jgi:hypothetical protein
MIDHLSQLVQGATRALVAQIEDELPALPWCDELRKAVQQDLEAEIGPAVAGVCERLVLAAVTPGLKFEGDDDA